ERRGAAVPAPAAAGSRGGPAGGHRGAMTMPLGGVRGGIATSGGDEVFLAEPLPPMRQRRALERQFVTEAHLTAEELVIRVLQPTRAQHLVGQVVHVLLYSANRGQALSGRVTLWRAPIPPGSRFSPESAPSALPSWDQKNE